MRHKLFVLLALSLVFTSFAASPTRAASTFASPAFEAQWRTDEAKIGNFWGPLTLAKDGQQEDYTDAAGGKRLVQYFDKGRMELGADGSVTSGLLAQELISGRVQTGNATFTNRTPYAYPAVGDPRNGGVTYALISRSSEFTDPTPMGDTNIPVIGFGTEQDVARATEQLNATMYAGRPLLAMPAYDDATRQYVERVFADYREKVGFANVGFAVSRTIYEVVPIGGKRTTVLYQIFQRRVLTFTPDNPPAFQVEMGNIGQHYYQWRYGTASASPAASQQPSQAAASGNTATDRMNLLRVTLPSGWRVNTTTGGDAALQVVAQTSGRTTAALTFYADISDKAGSSATLVGNASLAMIAREDLTTSSFTNVTTGTVTDVDINDYYGKRIPYTGRGSDGTTLYGLYFVVIHRGRIFTFIGRSADPALSDIDAIVRSVVWLDRP